MKQGQCTGRGVVLSRADVEGGNCYHNICRGAEHPAFAGATWKAGDYSNIPGEVKTYNR